MVNNLSAWRNRIAFLFTPEDSFRAFENQRAALLYPALKPKGDGLLKTVFWMGTSIASALLCAIYL